MNQAIISAAIDLVKREKPVVVAATGLIFDALGQRSKCVPLSDTIASVRGGIWGEEAAEGCGFPVLRSTNMRGVVVDTIDPAWRVVADSQAVACRLEDGDILVTKSSGSVDLVGKAALFQSPSSNQTYLFSNFCLRLRPDKERALPKYLAWFLRAPQALVWRYESQQNAVGLRNLQTEGFLRQRVPLPDRQVQQAIVEFLDHVDSASMPVDRIPILPPLSEQKRIVARIEELAGKIEEAKGLRAEAGGMVEWAFEAQVGCALSAATTTCRTGKLGNLSSKIGSGSTPRGGKSVYSQTGTPFIRSLNVRMRRFQSDGIVYISPSIHASMSGTRVVTGDVLLNITGASIGRVACAPASLIEANVSQHVSIIRPRDMLDSRFLMYWLSQPSVQSLIGASQKGATREAITKAQVENFEIPLLPLPEQRRIVAYLDDLQSKVDSLKQLQAASSAELDALLPSILDKAFKGEL